MDNPCPGWLADSCWDNITELDKLTNFHGIMASFEQYPRDWNVWFTSPEPENAPLPGNFSLRKKLRNFRIFLKVASQFIDLVSSQVVLGLQLFTN